MKRFFIASFVLCIFALSMYASRHDYLSENNIERLPDADKHVSSCMGVPEFDGYHYVKTIPLYYDNNGRRESFNAWLYRSKNGKSYGVATDEYVLRSLETFLYQDWMPSWVRQCKYHVKLTAYYCNI